MLSITRRPSEEIVIVGPKGEVIRIVYVSHQFSQVRLCLEAPANYLIMRKAADETLADVQKRYSAKLEKIG